MVEIASIRNIYDVDDKGARMMNETIKKIVDESCTQWDWFEYITLIFPEWERIHKFFFRRKEHLILNRFRSIAQFSRPRCFWS